MDFLPSWPLHVTPLLAFGFLLAVGAIGGYFAHRLSWLPSITGFMVVGFLCGPSGIGLLSQETINGSRILIDIALVLILYRLGLSLNINVVRRSPKLLFIALAESTATFLAVFYALHSLFDISPFISALVGAIAVSSSPAVLLHVANEINAKGEVTDSTKTLVALNNTLSFIAFFALLPVFHYSIGSDWQTILLQPAYIFLGSLLLGSIVALGLHEIAVVTRRAAQFKLALVIGSLMIGVGIAEQLKLSMHFVPLIIGIVVRSLERDTVVSNIEFGQAFELFFIVLFVFAGAELHLTELITFGPIVLAFVVARSIAKLFGVTIMSTILRIPLRTGISSAMLLIPMAGLAIGLVQTSRHLFPEYAPMIAAIVLGAVTVFETIGPPIAGYAFRIAGESGEVNERAETTAAVDTHTPPVS